jgi:hypothetical protein
MKGINVADLHLDDDTPFEEGCLLVAVLSFGDPPIDSRYPGSGSCL